MNFAKAICHGLVGLLRGGTLAIFMIVMLTGCSDNIILPSQQQLSEFEAAGAIMPEIDLDRLLTSQGKIQDYIIRQDDLLEILMPTMLIQMSSEVTSANTLTHSHLARVDEAGQVTLPIVESIPAEGKTIAALESAIVAAYYPKYTTLKPSIVVRVAEYDTNQISVTGAVNTPGIYELPAHKMTLISAIMAAGGIVEDGAALIHVNQPGDQSEWIRQEKNNSSQFETAPAATPLSESRIRLSFQQTDTSGVGIINVKDGEKLLYAEELQVTDSNQRIEVVTRITLAHPNVPLDYISNRLCELADIIQPGSGGDCTAISTPSDELWQMLKKRATASSPTKPLLLPVKGMNIPFSDIALTDGASVVIEPLDPQVFTVMGLVQRPGVFAYPNNVKYNLLQAIAFAGGVDEIANPRYVRVYRQKADGSIIDATFTMKDSIPTSAAALSLKPGDVVAVEQTPRTKMNLMLAEIFAVRVGAAASYNYLYYSGEDLRSGN